MTGKLFVTQGPCVQLRTPWVQLRTLSMHLYKVRVTYAVLFNGAEH